MFGSAESNECDCDAVDESVVGVTEKLCSSVVAVCLHSLERHHHV